MEMGEALSASSVGNSDTLRSWDHLVKPRIMLSPAIFATKVATAVADNAVVDK